MDAGKDRSCRIVINFRLGQAVKTRIPVARGPPEGEDLTSFVSRIARHAGIAWDEATVKLPDGSRKEVRRDAGRF